MNKEDLYRPNVAMIIVSNNYPQKKEIFIAQRNDLTDIWQFPQGGIDKGEKVQEALFRELEEEIGTLKAKVVAEYPEWISYDFPEKIAKTMKPYKGQIQRYFLLKLKKSAKINLQTKHPEFLSYKFVSVDEVLDLTAHFKKPVYEKVINYFKAEGHL
ncbi:MAG: RNA pyrophosphohydrolase [Epsilonproteobacteria bacterium]|nr:RNA pyrophosphohydrolase [Campylobacterota bacterium]OIO15556.1 MAG: RNA pyrophosphohydrolase [Helicobacteraceae bacterium CG1_02_36_14]PIP09785.1 MAG: RNA pyrophosphohydrolase [Sulfurimonas sp. CG23_combo_of_CG06-09_8_20_14_all_36_33]PIS23999.1 MAG: RNA pyrophosphohydrolase [Sulfurimonas sp. CG08_land_8_20_14_0_20_36_33]PIU35483.1 MAG: RNA pyrophosphohydrolase [Sulfurimonas sp. CG07_land_8_20_14_0_80_36_56]PIV05404.1 MAG: RNA pyrophosphohydrolase [Sulfurimonas sp. CG03_land_8_20_14_0_80_36